MWRDPDATRVLPGHSTVTYNYRGDVFCQDPVTGQVHTMSNGGFEVRRQRLKKRCPPALRACPAGVKTPAPSSRACAFPYRPIGGFYAHGPGQLSMEARVCPSHGGGTGEQSVGCVVRVGTPYHSGAKENATPLRVGPHRDVGDGARADTATATGADAPPRGVVNPTPIHRNPGTARRAAASASIHPVPP